MQRVHAQHEKLLFLQPLVLDTYFQLENIQDLVWSKDIKSLKLKNHLVKSYRI